MIHQHPRLLLGMKKRGFGAGRWNGFGGHVEEGETVEETARREVKEEAGIEIDHIEKRGIIEFAWKGKEEILEVHIFYGSDFVGEPTESEEMKPQWFPLDQIPYDEMWSDDRYWLPLFLEGKKFEASFLFDGKDKVIKHELEEVAQV